MCIFMFISIFRFTFILHLYVCLHVYVHLYLVIFILIFILILIFTFFIFIHILGGTAVNQYRCRHSLAERARSWRRCLFLRIVGAKASPNFARTLQLAAHGGDITVIVSEDLPQVFGGLHLVQLLAVGGETLPHDRGAARHDCVPLTAFCYSAPILCMERVG